VPFRYAYHGTSGRSERASIPSIFKLTHYRYTLDGRQKTYNLLYLYESVACAAPNFPPRSIQNGAERNLSEAYFIDGWSLSLLLSGIAGSGLFAWGVRGHFVGDKTPTAMNIILALSLIGIVVFLFDVWVTRAPDWARATGFSLHLGGIALFGWAVLATRQNRPAMAFAGNRPDHVLRSGPYSAIRHPFYTSYLLFWLGSAIGTSSPILLLIFLALAVIYTIAALGEERDFSRSSLRDEYEAFRKSTGLFWPKLRLARRQL
jgi:protein-S-isoprenylcysteine O-methyltransferase Ste14